MSTWMEVVAKLPGIRKMPVYNMGKAIVTRNRRLSASLASAAAKGADSSKKPLRVSCIQRINFLFRLKTVAVGNAQPNILMAVICSVLFMQ